MNEYQRFVRLVYEAHAGSEVVDYFDLHSENLASVATFRRLEAEQRSVFLALVEHVRDHAEAIIATIGDPPIP